MRARIGGTDRAYTWDDVALRHIVTGAATTRGVVARAGFFATMQEQARQLTWGVTTGESDSNYALAAELLLSFAPGVGLLFDGRDVVKQLVALWPGGDDPDWAVFALAALGIATEVPPLNVGVNAAVSALKNAIKAVPVGPLRRWLFRNTLSGITAALRTGDKSWFSRNGEFFSRLTRECAGARYESAAASSAAFCLKSTLNRLGQQAAGDYASLRNRIGDAEAEDLLARLTVQADIDDGDLRRVLEALGSEFDAATVDGLRAAGKMEIVARAAAKANWDAVAATKYLEKVNHFGASDLRVVHFDRVSDIPGNPGSVHYAKMGTLEFGRKGTQFEFDVMEHFRSDRLVGIQIEPGNDPRFTGDVDTLTDSFLVSSKHTKPIVRSSDKITSDLLRVLREDAHRNGLIPVIAVPDEFRANPSLDTDQFVRDVEKIHPDIVVEWVVTRIPGLPS
ncbi:MAG: hypothetical protein AAGN64_04505 [Bacteroidota bacterium]